MGIAVGVPDGVSVGASVACGVLVLFGVRVGARERVLVGVGVRLGGGVIGNDVGDGSEGDPGAMPTARS